MTMHKYAQASKRHERELVASLTNEDIETLAATLKDMGLNAWLEWKNEHQKVILGFLQLTPAKRTKIAASSDVPLLVFAGIEHCYQAHAILDFVSSYEHYLLPGESYRNTTAMVGSLFPTLLDTGIPHWTDIFGDERFPGPFDDSL